MKEEFPFDGWTALGSNKSPNLPAHRGIYMLAKYDGEPPIVVDACDEAIIYIGETSSQTIDIRLWQFKRSALEGKNGHSGGWKFRKELMGNQNGTCPSWLYVATMPVTIDNDEPRSSAWIRRIERILLWQYVDEVGNLPLCNTK